MTAFLIKILSMLMSVVVFLSGTFPALFDGKQYINPYGADVFIGNTSALRVVVDEPIDISDYETLKELAENKSPDFNTVNEKCFEQMNLVCIPVTIPSTAYKVFIKSVVENGDTLEVEYALVRDFCAGLAILDYTTIYVSTSKDIRNVKANESKINVPFCIH